MVLYRLALSNFRVRKVRSALTVAAVALSVSLVVAVTSGYRSMEGAALRYLNHYMGAADGFIVPAAAFQNEIPEKLVDELNADPDVRQASGRLETDTDLPRAPGTGKPVSTRRSEMGALPADKTFVQLIGIRPDSAATEGMELQDGKWFTRADGDEAVMDQVAIERCGLKLGALVQIPGLHKITLRIVGVVHKPTFFAEESPTIYVPLHTLQEFAGQANPPEVSRISINLRANANFDQFTQRWTRKLAQLDPGLTLRMRRDSAGDLERHLRIVHLLSYLGGAVSMVTAMFIIFSALVMGVTERQRVLALLRAIGGTRLQVFRLVVIEGFLLAGAGIVIGTLMGLLWIELIVLRFHDLFSAGASYSYGGILFAAAGSLLTALAASVLPGWLASRVSPLEAMSAQNTAGTRPAPVGWAALGVALVCIDPFLFFGPVQPIVQRLGFHDPAQVVADIRLVGHFALGLPGIFAGFFLLAPLLVWTLERAMTPLLALVLRIPTALLRQQFSGGMWRAAGTAAALMVGLATLISMQIGGHSLIGGWRLPDKFPDIFIWSPNLVSWKDQKKLAAIPGIEPGTMMPVVITTPMGDSKLMLAAQAALSLKNMGVMFFGVYPAQALKMIGLEFRNDDGTPIAADLQAITGQRVAEEMKKGRRIIVTEEFRQARHVRIGDTFRLHTTVHGWQNYTIAGIVWSPGADVLVSLFDLGRMMDQQTAGSVFGTIADAKNDFGVTGVSLFGANLAAGTSKEQLLKRVQASLGDLGMRAGDVRQIKAGIERGLYRLLDLLSSVAIAAMAVASLGVTNTVMASVRSRRWQFGVLRSVGMARSELLRLVLAEAALLGALGAILGTACGIELAIDGGRLGAEIIGYSPPMLIPWLLVLGGCAAVLAIALVASLWPAASTARAQPLELLAAGRAAT